MKLSRGPKPAAREPHALIIASAINLGLASCNLNVLGIFWATTHLWDVQTLERRLCAAGVIFEDAAAAARPAPKKTVRQGTYQKTASDEDSDFD